MTELRLVVTGSEAQATTGASYWEGFLVAPDQISDHVSPAYGELSEGGGTQTDHCCQSRVCLFTEWMRHTMLS